MYLFLKELTKPRLDIFGHNWSILRHVIILSIAIAIPILISIIF